MRLRVLVVASAILVWRCGSREEKARDEVKAALSEIDAAYAEKIRNKNDYESLRQALVDMAADEKRQAAEASKIWQDARSKFASTDPGNAFVDYRESIKDLMNILERTDERLKNALKRIEHLEAENVRLKKASESN